MDAGERDEVCSPARLRLLSHAVSPSRLRSIQRRSGAWRRGRKGQVRIPESLWKAAPNHIYHVDALARERELWLEDRRYFFEILWNVKVAERPIGYAIGFVWRRRAFMRV